MFDVDMHAIFIFYAKVCVCLCGICMHVGACTHFGECVTVIYLLFYSLFTHKVHLCMNFVVLQYIYSNGL